MVYLLCRSLSHVIHHLSIASQVSPYSTILQFRSNGISLILLFIYIRIKIYIVSQSIKNYNRYKND
jgi:hypothetical protein